MPRKKTPAVRKPPHCPALLEEAELVRAVKVAMREFPGKIVSPRTGRRIRDVRPVYNIQAYRPRQKVNGVWVWALHRVLWESVELVGVHEGIPVGGLHNRPLCRDALIVCGIEPHDEVDWRPADTLPEDYYAAG